LKKLTKLLTLMAVLITLIAAVTLTAAAEGEVTNFVYTVHSDGVYIEGYEGETPENLVFPSEIGGRPVVGISDFWASSSGVKTVTIPDSITSLPSWYLFDHWEDLETVNIGAGVKDIQLHHFNYCYNLKAVNVSENNPYLCSIDGVVYDNLKSSLIFLPEGKTTVTIPSTVSDLWNLYWNSGVTVTLEAGNPNFVAENNVIYNQAKTRIIHCNPAYAGEYVAPSTVTSIAYAAFAGCKNLTSVMMPRGITEIAYMQFANCTGLQKVGIPSSVTAICEGAFYNCGDIPEIHIETMTNWCNIDRYDAFSTPRGYDLYINGQKQETLVLPRPTTEIKWRAFAFCKATAVQFHTDPLIIEEEAFLGSSLKFVSIPDTISRLGRRAFADCYQLETVDMQSDCDPYYLFEGCPIKNLTLSEDRGSIGAYLFANSDMQGSYSIPATVTVIGYGSFYNCDDLTSVSVPANVSLIYPRAFAECDDLQSIQVDKNNWYYSSGAKGELLDKYGQTLIQVPGGLSGNYTVPDTVYEIAYFAFEGCGKLTSVTIPDTVQSICGAAFKDTSLKHINFPEGLEIIADNMFGWGSPLQSVYLPASITEIEEYAFCADSLKDVYFGGTKTQWEAIEISEWGNWGLNGATIHYNSQPIKQSGWVNEGGTYYYINADGSYAKSWKQVGGVWYYFDTATGAMVTGWKQVGKVWYYFAPSGAMATGWKQIGKTWYLFNASGAMQTGWVKQGSTWYLFNASGAMQTGWVKSGNTWYYFNASGAMATGWLKSGNTWYYFHSSGAMATGWLKSGNTWYYFNASGAMATGWLKSGNTWYYFNASGAMATGNVKLGNKTYRFNASGACLNP